MHILRILTVSTALLPNTLWATAQVIVGTGSVAGSGGSSDLMVGFRASNGVGGGGPSSAVNGFRVVIAFAPAQATVLEGDACTVDAQTSRLTVQRAAASGVELAPEITCLVRFSYGGLVQFSEISSERVFRNLLGDSVPGMVTAGAVAPQNSPASSPPGLTYTPNFAANGRGDGIPEIVFPASPIGQLLRRELQVRAVGGTGGLGGASVGLCSAFRQGSTGISSYIPNVIQYNFGAGADAMVPIRLECIPQELPQRALMSCIEGQNPGVSRLRFWDMICPAGLPIPVGDQVFVDNFEI